MSRTASSAASRVSAATAATRWPMKRTTSGASTGRSRSWRPYRTCPMSAPVRTATTPGSARAAEVSIEAIRACGTGLARQATCRMPSG
jgi:hypothetical protein